ncbi:unnamed protein product [Cuscuta epithymum]|uniref:Uncharacterized protein n=1 Tax=Cuscuta epithymum TaxID=186058 RepID=A0AAV0DKL4_9ASTE|nr:unnamed protein product [Cuscuta epithymum]
MTMGYLSMASKIHHHCATTFLNLLPMVILIFSIITWVWQHIRNWMGLGHEMTTFLSAIKWITKTHKGSTMKAKAVRLAFCASIYYIWHVRNELRFDGGLKTEADVISNVKHVVYKILYSLYPHELINF